VIHITMIVHQEVHTYCGSLDMKETMRAEHYFSHVIKEDCCKELRDKICSECLETWERADA